MGQDIVVAFSNSMEKWQRNYSKGWQAFPWESFYKTRLPVHNHYKFPVITNSHSTFVSALNMPTLFFHFFLFLITTSVTNLIPAVHSNCIESQKQSLLELEASLDYGDESTKLTTWNASTDCCSWRGVTCDTIGHVVGLDLSSESIRSKGIDNSRSLFQLQHLQSLNLVDHSFNSSSIPSAIGRLIDLRYLNLTSASFSGRIPVEILRLTGLKVLDLSKNFDLSVENPNLSMIFQNLTGLRELHLGYSLNLSTQGSDWCEGISSSLPNLRVLSLSGCGLSGPICDLPNSIRNLKMLSTIDLSNCSFTGSLPKSIENLTQLVDLDISWNRFNSPISSIHWETLANLERLDLSNNQLYGTIPSSLVSLSKLESLILSDNQFSGQLPEFSNTSSNLLDNLDLGNNNFEGEIPSTIFNLQGLQNLNLSANNFSGFPFNGHHQQPRNLSRVDLSHNSLLFDNHSSNSAFLQINTLILASNKLRAFPDFFKRPIHS
ncbi:receptor-like protein 37 [Argentina anserina]|uniref:receptor-like protein 37 n=1 Tax=Argentina anserina TaxID=57926 RepID=UPI00217658CF|nr:receptor-like protein 37 [Potentilla anserina]